MVLLTCDFDINFALMSSLANELIAAFVLQQQQRVCGGGNGAVAVLRPRLSLEPITYEQLVRDWLLLNLSLLLLMLLLMLLLLAHN